MTEVEAVQRRIFGGDFGPWYRYVPEAWQQAAAPELAVCEGRREAALDGELEDSIAFWNPLVHLTMGGLGWINVPVGLRRWVDMGSPLEDPILRTIDARWGRDIELFIAWLGDFGDVASVGAGDAKQMERNPHYQRWFGGGSDSLHLRAHAQWMPNFPTGERPGWRHVTRLVPKGSTGDHAVVTLVSDSYVDLFDALSNDVIEPQLEGGRSRRVALWCPPIGWLGTFRKSRETGRWFRGQHRWHVLGH